MILLKWQNQTCSFWAWSAPRETTSMWMTQRSWIRATLYALCDVAMYLSLLCYVDIHLFIGLWTKKVKKPPGCITHLTLPSTSLQPSKTRTDHHAAAHTETQTERRTHRAGTGQRYTASKWRTGESAKCDFILLCNTLTQWQITRQRSYHAFSTPFIVSKFLFSFKKRLSFYFYHLRNFLSRHFLFIFSLPAIFFLPLSTFSPLVVCPLSSYMIPLSISQFSFLFLPVLSFIFLTNHSYLLSLSIAPFLPIPHLINPH